ncbi:MAG: acetyltransferase [Clostridiaceae bacterium]|nr:acetyltransferase [Clostridiaceae bacterium]
MDSKVKDLVIIGAGDFGREVAALVANINEVKKQWNFKGFVDDALKGTTIEGFPIIGRIDSIYNMNPKPYVVISIANTRIKKSIAQELSRNDVPLAILVHPSVIISDHVELGGGSIVSAGTIFAINTNLGEHCILNLGCRIGHDTIIGNYSSCMPGTNLAGKVNVGEGCYFGLNTCVINGLEIGEWSTIGAGAAVVRDIPAHSLAVGVPAKVIKKLDS